MTANPVDTAYRHVDKVAMSDDSFDRDSPLKWYDLHEEHRVVGDDVRAAAHETARALVSSSDVGFVILHRCGEDLYFLLICRWRNENELWETVATKRGDGAFDTLDPERTHATFCVWELAVVNAERLAWIDYLRSERTPAELTAYRALRFAGVV
jgi:hypothetical protein